MNCYEKLNLWLSEDNTLYKDCKSLDYNFTDAKLYNNKDTFLRARPTVEHFKNEPQLVEVMKKFSLVPLIFKLEANTVYNWHVDAFRAFALNCLLTDSDDYLTIFINDLKYSAKHYRYFPIRRLKYESRRFYMFNSFIPHFVANYSNQPRYILTIARYSKNRMSNPENPALSDFSHFLNMVNDLSSMNLIDHSEDAACLNFNVGTKNNELL